jgi:hypothetical protein
MDVDMPDGFFGVIIDICIGKTRYRRASFGVRVARAEHPSVVAKRPAQILDSAMYAVAMAQA